MPRCGPGTRRGRAPSTKPWLRPGRIRHPPGSSRRRRAAGGSDARRAHPAGRAQRTGRAQRAGGAAACGTARAAARQAGAIPRPARSGRAASRVAERVATSPAGRTGIAGSAPAGTGAAGGDPAPGGGRAGDRLQLHLAEGGEGPAQRHRGARPGGRCADRAGRGRGRQGRAHRGRRGAERAARAAAELRRADQRRPPPCRAGRVRVRAGDALHQPFVRAERRLRREHRPGRDAGHRAGRGADHRLCAVRRQRRVDAVRLRHAVLPRRDPRPGLAPPRAAAQVRPVLLQLPASPAAGTSGEAGPEPADR